MSTRTQTSRSICGFGSWRRAHQQHLLRRRRRPVDLPAGAGRRSDNILRFEQDFPGAQASFGLEQQLPLDRAYPRARPPDSSRTTRAVSARRSAPNGDDGDKVVVEGCLGRRGRSARHLARTSSSLQTPGPYAERDRHSGARLVPDARLRGPLHHASACDYRVIGGPRFYERQEIRDATAYFRA